MALGATAAALKGWRGLENMPQGPSAGLAAGWEVVQSDYELMALVADVGGTFAKCRWLNCDLLIPFDLAFIGIQDLWKERRGRGVLLRVY